MAVQRCTVQFYRDYGGQLYAQYGLYIAGCTIAQFEYTTVGFALPVGMPFSKEPLSVRDEAPTLHRFGQSRFKRKIQFQFHAGKHEGEWPKHRFTRTKKLVAVDRLFATTTVICYARREKSISNVHRTLYKAYPDKEKFFDLEAKQTNWQFR